MKGMLQFSTTYLLYFTMKSASLAMPAVAGILLLLLLSPASEAAIACSDVIKDLKPCVNYLQNGTGLPPSDCCAGASALAAAASTTADRRAACSCVKSALQKMNLKQQLVKALPGNCKISLPFEVSPNVDCTKIN